MKNVYQWLDRFENRDLDDGLYDELETVLTKSPDEAGYDRVQAWSPRFVQHWLKTHFDVEYTQRHVRRLMDDAGLSWRTARPKHYDADPKKITEFQDTY